MKSAILHVIRSVDRKDGGTVEVVRQFSETLVKEGHTIETVSLDLPDAPAVSEFPFTLHAMGETARTYGWSRQLIPWLKQNAPRFDGVIVHGLWQFHGYAVWKALRGSGVPYYVFPHGMLDPWFREAYPIKHFKKTLYWKLIEHRILRDARSVLFTCEEEQRLARETFRPFEHRHEIVPLGTSDPPGQPEQLREAFLRQFPSLRNQRLLLFLGRIHDKKGCDLLLQAARQIEHPWHIVIAGPAANDLYLDQLKNLAKGQAVTFTGPIIGEIKNGALAAAEVLVLPSHQENFGMVVIEALASSLPVLITNKVNIWREVEAAHAGLVEPDTVDGIRTLLQKFLSIPHDSMQVAARNCFLTHFSAQASANRLLKVIGRTES